MAHGIVIFLVDIFERAEILKRAADGFGEVLLAHEHPEALHAALRASLHLDGEDVHVLNGEVVDFGDALARLFPIMHPRTLDGGLVAHQFQSCHHFRNAAFIHQILWRACHDKLDEFLRHVAIETQCGKQKAGVEKEIFHATLVCLGIQGETVGSSSHHGSDDAGKGEQMEGFANLIAAETVGNLTEGQLMPYLVAYAMERETKKVGIGTARILVEIVLIGEENVIMNLLALQKVGRGFPCGNRFGHSAHKHIDAELLHELGMKWSIERMRGICRIAHGEHSLHAHGYEKLVEGHGIHEK